jgi:hypothetical protein
MRASASPPTSRHDLLGELRDVERRAAELEPGSGEFDPALLARVAQELGELLERAIERMDGLRHLEEAPPPGAPGPGSDAIDDGCPSASMRVGDLCFAGAFELERALQKLTSAHGSDELLVAVETARRKVRRGVRAILAAAHETSPTELPSAYPRADIESALAVRRLYRDFRKSLRRPVDESRDAVLVALRYAAGALAALVSSPQYAHARASDRALLRGLQQRILDWARRTQDIGAGLELLEDVHTCADLLRDINRRQELRAHDGALRSRLQNGLSAAPSAFFVHLAALVGLDDALDDVIDRASTEPHAAVLPEALRRLSELS